MTLHLVSLSDFVDQGGLSYNWFSRFKFIIFLTKSDLGFLHRNNEGNSQIVRFLRFLLDMQLCK